MAKRNSKMRLEKWRASIPGSFLTALLYAIMVILILIFFTGNGQFIYEAF